MMEWIKTRFTAIMMNMLYPYHVASISKACQDLLFVVGFLKAWQGVLIRKIKLLTLVSLLLLSLMF